MDSTPLTPAMLGQQDAILIVTDHTRFDWELILRHARLIVDTRNATAGVPGMARVVKA
jgi:UDP-N-acetyl-D-glucosamine dehydrogenase